jgi:hypothetical protein
MEGLWIIFYWSIQILAWIVIPICQSYVSNGEFSFFRRFVRSLWENVRIEHFQTFLKGNFLFNLFWFGNRHCHYSLFVFNFFDFNKLFTLELMVKLESLKFSGKFNVFEIFFNFLVSTFLVFC